MSRQSSFRRIALAAGLAAAACLALTPVASAAKNAGAGNNGGGGSSGGGGGSSLALVMVTDKNGDGLPNWGDTVTFRVSTTATTQPSVSVTCYQNGTKVYYRDGGFYAGDPWGPEDQLFTLESYAWTAGEAECTATLFYVKRGKAVDLDSIGFHVSS